MTSTIFTIAACGLMLTVIGFGIRDIIKNFTSFYRSRVVPCAVFEREGAGASSSGLDRKDQKFRLASENKHTRPSGRKRSIHLSNLKGN